MEPKQASEKSIDSKQIVGIVTDNDMTLHKCKSDHVERPQRLTSIVEHLKKTDLLTKCVFIDKLTEVDDAHIKTIHSQNYIDYVREICEEYDEEKDLTPKDTYYNKSTDMAARKALGGAKLLVDKVISGEWNSGYGVLRPPGHHAAIDGKVNGFCIFSTVALTALYAKKKYGLKRILIFDWDVHHGDSTQKFLYENSEILFISLHRFDGGKFYPGPSGSVHNIGKGKGAGFNLNIPWESDGDELQPLAGNPEYIYAFERIAYPIIKSFAPELIFVSAGFDSGRGDPLGSLDVTQDGYAYMLKRLQTVQSKIVMCLEGGYNLNTISVASEACVRVLLGEELPLACSETGLTLDELKNTVAPNKAAVDVVAKACNVFDKYWGEQLRAKELNEFHLLALSNSKNKCALCTGNILTNRITEDKFFKKLNPFEHQFYESFKKQEGELYTQHESIKEWLSPYLGTEKIEGVEFIVLQNLVGKLNNASVLKIKVYPSMETDELSAVLVGKGEGFL